MDTFSDNNDLSPVRLPQWGDDVRLRSTLSAEWLSDAESEIEGSADERESREEDEQREERLSYRRRRDAEGDSRRWRDVSSDRGSVWERGATTAEASERPRRELVSAYLDESSVVRVTRRSNRRGFSLVPDESDQEQQTSPWGQFGDDTYDDDLREAEQRASSLWGRHARGTHGDDQQSSGQWSRIDDTFEDDALTVSDLRMTEQRITGFRSSQTSNVYDDDVRSDVSRTDADLRMSEQRITGRRGYSADDTFAGDTFVDDTRADDDLLMFEQRLTGRRGYQPDASHESDDAHADQQAARRIFDADDTFVGAAPQPVYADVPTLRRHSFVDDADTAYVADADTTSIADTTYVPDSSSAAARGLDHIDEPQGIWAIVDAVCFVPEAVGSFVLGIMGRVRVRGLVAMIVALLVAATLYNPVRNLYLANRRLDTLEKTYDAIAAQNEQLEHEIEVLQTREGIENEARAHGYVEPGETKVVVKGLPTENDTYTITETELPDDRAWYIKVLDYLFGYNPETK